MDHLSFIGAWSVRSDGDVVFDYDVGSVSVTYSYGRLISPYSFGSDYACFVTSSGNVDYFRYYVGGSYSKIALRRRIAPAMRTVSTLMVTSATVMATASTVIPTGAVLLSSYLVHSTLTIPAT